MNLVITDVSVLFDLYSLEALPEFFTLDMEISTTIFVYNEILQSEQKVVFEIFENSKKLRVWSFSSAEEIELREFNLKYSNRSFNDKSIIWKALKSKSILLTCDAKIKKEAKHHKIEVHGSIWVITELEKQNIVSVSKAIALLEQLKIVNTRLPYDEIDRIIKLLKHK